MLALLPLSLLAAVAPTLVYVYLIWWCDRYEREPARLLVAAFVWGAAPAIALAVAAELLLQRPIELFALGQTGELMQVAGVSPVVEEIAKGLGLFGLFLFYRREIDGVLDGVVYGGLVGAGFAMTENFFYFLSAALESDVPNWLAITFLRAVVFGLNHAFYTGITGAFVGLAWLSRERRMRWWVPAVGLALAMLVHMLHNLSASLAAYNPLTLVLSAILNWGGVSVLLTVIVLALRQEQGWIRLHLADEVPNVLSTEHYALAQRQARRWNWVWARILGQTSPRARLEAELQHLAIELAFRKRHLSRAEGVADAALAQEVISLRERLTALSQTLAQLPLA